MEIITQHMTSPSKCSIENIRVIREGWHVRGDSGVVSYLRISLKPEPQYKGLSFEPRKTRYHLKIGLDELQEMVGALTRELDLCHQVLNAHGLLSKMDEVAEALKKKQKTDEAQPFQIAS